MIQIKLFNLLRGAVDYEYIEDTKTFTLEITYEEFDILMDLLKDVMNGITLKARIIQNVVEISNFEVVLEKLEIDPKEFYDELSWEDQ